MIRYINLAEYLWLAEQVTGVDASVLAKASRVDLADSALHAPAAGFGDEEFYPGIYDKAAVLCCRLAWNHPLPDGSSDVKSSLRNLPDRRAISGGDSHLGPQELGGSVQPEKNLSVHVDDFKVVRSAAARARTSASACSCLLPLAPTGTASSPSHSSWAPQWPERSSLDEHTSG